MRRSAIVFVVLAVCVMSVEGVGGKKNGTGPAHPEKHQQHTTYQMLRWQWSHVNTPYMILIWLLVSSFAEIVFKISGTSNYLPESSLLIVVGLVLGLFLKWSGFSSDAYQLESHAFFIYLLPPIIFDAGYFMPNRALFENIDSVMLFSVVGTIWNTLSIGGGLLAISYYYPFSMPFSTFEILVFSALISAVDPVAVIAVFQEIHVNEFLFINVFGEALFNDGVTVVLYNMFASFAEIGPANLSPVEYSAGAFSFVVVALGGFVIGVLFAVFAALATKYTHLSRTLAPVFIFIIPYMAYLTAEMLSLSSIIAIAVCGMCMKQYVKGNITTAASNSVKYFVKMLASCTETVIFMFLGLSTVSYEHKFDVPFMAATVILCLVCRTVGVVAQCWFLNRFRQKKFSNLDQFVLSYGGLRGAIAFGLVVSMSNHITAKPMFITTTIAVIYFTVFLQGITIRPLLNFLNVEKSEDRVPTMTESVYLKYLDYMMSGVEDIAGQQGHYSFRDNFERFNAKVLRPVLMRNEKKKDFDASKIVRAYAKITLQDAMRVESVMRKITKVENKQLAKLKMEESKYGLKNSGFHSDEDVQQTVTSQKSLQLQDYLKGDGNVDQLYQLFSQLLDRKLDELNTGGVVGSDVGEGDDIAEDYMQQMSSNSNSGSRSNLRGVEDEEETFARSMNRRRSTGGVRDRVRHFP